MAANSSAHADNQFGPSIEGFRGNFDFTLLFEDAFLALVPSAILLLIAPIRAVWLWTSPKKVSDSSSRLSKVAFLAGFAALELTLLLLWATNGAWSTPLSIPASALDFAAAGGLCVLSILEHSRTVRPSILINLYLILSLPFDVARTRTLWLIRDFRHMAIVQTISLALKSVVLILEANGKRDILLFPYQDLPPEATSGIYSRSVFWWLNPIFRIGFKKDLELVDLDQLDPSLKSERLYRMFIEAYGKADKTRKHALFFAAFGAIKWSAAIAIVPRTLLIGLKFTQPFLLSRTTTYVSSDDPDSIGWGLVGAYGLVYVGLAILTASYTHLQNRSITMLRGGLVSLIYAKTIDLSVNSVDESSSMTLMSSDMERITTSLNYMHDLWAAFIEVAISILILERTVGIACIAPAVITLLVTSLVAYATKYSVRAQKIWVEAIQTRVNFTARMLAAMRSIKLLGLSRVVENVTQHLRDTEVSKAQTFRRFFIFRIFMGNFPSAAAPLVTFAIFVVSASITGVTLSTAQAYMALSVIQLIEEPLGGLLASYTLIRSSLVCYDRIQAFLELPSRYDHRLRMSGPGKSPTSSTDLFRDIIRQDVELRSLKSASITVSADCFVVQDASFGWAPEKDPVLHDINLRVRSTSFTFLIGPVGAGKTTLLRGLLGETHSSKGFVYASSTEIAFADQDPWIQNATVRENIVGLASYEPQWYHSVVRCCALQDDLDAMPDGDETRVGSNGLHLSGGQKQRLALARAVYSKKSIMMLDDVFSGLDADTEEHIFTMVFGPDGLLRPLKTTVVLITHAAHRLSYSDHIAVIKDGVITEQGTFEHLRNNGGYVSSLAAKMKDVKDRPKSSEKVVTQNRSNAKLTTAAQDLARRSGDWSIYKYYSKEAGVPAIAIFVTFCTILALGMKGPALLLNYWTAAIAKHGNSVNGMFMGLFSIVAAVTLASLLASLVVFMLIIIPRTSSNLHASLLQTVIQAPLSFFTRTDSGSLTSRFSNDLAIVDTELPMAIIQTSFIAWISLLTFALMLVSAKEYAAIVPFLVVTLWAIQKIYLRTSRQIRLLDLEAKSPLFSQFQESLTGLTTIRAFGWAEEFRNHHLVLLDNSQKPFYFLFCIQRWLSVVLDLVVAGLAVVLMVIVVVLRSHLQAGFVALALLNVMSFNEVLASLIKSWTMLETSIGAISRIRSFITSTEQEPMVEEKTELAAAWPNHGEVTISGFSASYSPSSRSVISDINLEIRAGEKIGICGRSGSGKSSLLASLLHILEYRDGCILIDDIDLSFVPRNVLRERLNVIPQEPYFITGTFRLNIDPWSYDASAQGQASRPDRVVVEALQRVGIWELVQARGGLDAEMESDALSQGQKQLFCLARALLRKSKILILDEVSSSVDVATDALMQRIIRSDFEGCTIITVAHRLNTIVDYDKIAVMSAGKVVEFDTPGHLLERASAFKELYEA